MAPSIHEIANPTALADASRITPRRLETLPSPLGLPLLGNALALDVTRLHLVFEDWARAHGPRYTFKMGPQRWLVVGDLAPIRQVLEERPENYRRASQLEPVVKEFGAHGLFSAEGEAWKRQRKLVMPAFSMRQLKDLHPSIVRFTERLRAHWQRAALRGEVVDVRRDLMRYAVDVTSYVVFGRDLNTLETPDSDLQLHFGRIFSAINRRTNSLIPYWRWFKLPRDRAVDTSLRVVHDTLAKFIAEGRQVLATRAGASRSAKTVLDAFLISQREASRERPLSDSEIVGNVLTLLLAGEDTTSNTMAWMLHYAARDPSVQTGLQEEADRVLGSSDLAESFDDVAKLKVTGAVTHETLRLRSAAPLLFLEPVRDVVLAGIAVPAHTPIVLLTRFCSTSSGEFAEPGRFDASRWLEHGSTGCPHNTRAALAFGSGPRTCPGRTLALVECAMVLSMVAKNFVLEPVSSPDSVTEYFDFTMQPAGLKLRFQPREQRV
ncbi:MAG TPA: cytochrome P450 [Polyangiaceae bacterium]